MLEYRKALENLSSLSSLENIYDSSISPKCVQAINFALKDLKKNVRIKNGEEWIQKLGRIYCHDIGRKNGQIMVVFELDKTDIKNAINGRFRLLNYEINAEIDEVLKAYTTHAGL